MEAEPTASGAVIDGQQPHKHASMMSPARMWSLKMSDDAADFVRPAWYWWILILGGRPIFLELTVHSDFHGWWVENMHAMPSQKALVWIWIIGVIPLHLFEGWYAYRVCHKIGLESLAWKWAIQCFVIGYPSTHLLNKRKKRAASAA